MWGVRVLEGGVCGPTHVDYVCAHPNRVSGISQRLTGLHLLTGARGGSHRLAKWLFIKDVGRPEWEYAQIEHSVSGSGSLDDKTRESFKEEAEGEES